MVEAMDVEGEENQEEQEPRPKPTMKNCINLCLVVANITVGIFSFTAVAGLRSHADMIDAYPSLMSPKTTWVAYTWLTIIILEGLFALAQLTPLCSDIEIVRIISPWWFIAGSLQLVWIFFVSFDQMFICTFLMLGTFFALMWMILTIDSIPWPNIFQFVFLRLPFALHAGWILVCLGVQVNQAAAKGIGLMAGFDPGLKIGLAITSMGTVCTIMTLFAVATARPDPFFCASVAWGFGLMALNLNDRLVDKKYNTTEFPYSYTITLGFMYVNAGICFLCACCTVLAFVLRFLSRCCVKKQGEEIVILEAEEDS